MKFKICKNGSNFYKVQQLKPSIIIFGIIVKKEKWVDAYMYICLRKHRVPIVESLKEANDLIEFLKLYWAQIDTDWNCIDEGQVEFNKKIKK